MSVSNLGHPSMNGRPGWGGSATGDSMEWSLELAPVAHFLRDLVQIKLRSIGSSPRAVNGGGERWKGVCGGWASSLTIDIVGE
jgi:hypothetical protein